MFLSNSEKVFLSKAESLSTLSNHRCKIGCIIVNKHKIISYGVNSNTKTEALQAVIDKKYFKCECSGKIHAETDALLYFIKNKIDLSGCTLYTFRRKSDGSLGCSRPCPRCMQLIKEVNIKKLVYTTEDGFAKERLYY